MPNVSQETMDLLKGQLAHAQKSYSLHLEEVARQQRQLTLATEELDYFKTRIETLLSDINILTGASV